VASVCLVFQCPLSCSRKFSGVVRLALPSLSSKPLCGISVKGEALLNRCQREDGHILCLLQVANGNFGRSGKRHAQSEGNDCWTIQAHFHLLIFSDKRLRFPKEPLDIRKLIGRRV
jgi:hypothetical protein